MTRGDWLRMATRCLKEKGRDSPRLTAELLLCFALSCSRLELLCDQNRTLHEGACAVLSSLLARRCAGEPLAYILGTKEFYGISLAVTPKTLIPRPDTETLVDAVLETYANDQPFTFVDLGTGSGAIAIAIAKNRAKAKGFYCDISSGAITVARANCALYGLETRLFPLIASFTHVPLRAHSLDVVVANPPYIAEDATDVMDEVRNYEPRTALFAKENGYADLFACIAQAARLLRFGGSLFVEHGQNQGESVRARMRAHFFSAKTKKDLAGRERISYGIFCQRA